MKNKGWKNWEEERVGERGKGKEDRTGVGREPREERGEEEKTMSGERGAKERGATKLID